MNNFKGLVAKIMAIKRTADDACRMRQGTVVRVGVIGGSPTYDVRLDDGEYNDLRCFDSGRQPGKDEVVWVLQFGGEKYLVLGVQA